MTEIINHPAQEISVQTSETFDQYADRLYKRSRRLFQHGDGTLIELHPDLEYSFLMLGLTRLATPEEFGVLYTTIMTAIAQAETQGLIPSDWVKTVATPLDVKPPSVPQRLIEDDAEVKIYLTGELQFSVTKQMKEPVEPVMPEETIPEE